MVSEAEKTTRRKFIASVAAGLAIGGVGGLIGGYYSAPSKTAQEVLKEVTTTVMGEKRPPPSKLIFGAPAQGHGYSMDQWCKSHGIWDKYMQKYNVEFSSFAPDDDWAAWAARKTDVGAFGSTELGLVRGGGAPGTTEDPWDVVMFARDSSPNVSSTVCRPDATYKSIADLKGARLGISGWSNATCQIFTVIAKRFYGLDMKKDFSVKIAPRAALPELLLKGDLDVFAASRAYSAPYLRPGTLRYVNPQYKNLGDEWEARTGYWGPSVTNFSCFTDYLKNNPFALLALLEAWEEMETIMETNVKEVLTTYPFWDRKTTSAEDEDWMIKEIYTQPKAYWYPDPWMTADYVIHEYDFAATAASNEVGFIKPQALNGLWSPISKPPQIP